MGSHVLFYRDPNESLDLTQVRTHWRDTDGSL